VIPKGPRDNSRDTPFRLKHGAPAMEYRSAKTEAQAPLAQIPPRP